MPPAWYPEVTYTNPATDRPLTVGSLKDYPTVTAALEAGIDVVRAINVRLTDGGLWDAVPQSGDPAAVDVVNGAGETIATVRAVRPPDPQHAAAAAGTARSRLLDLAARHGWRTDAEVCSDTAVGRTRFHRPDGTDVVTVWGHGNDDDTVGAVWRHHLPNGNTYTYPMTDLGPRDSDGTPIHDPAALEEYAAKLLTAYPKKENLRP